MNAPVSVRKFSKKVLQQVYNCKVDVIAGDANAAACKYFRNKKYKDLYSSSVAIMLRELQHEVNEGRPIANKLCIDYYHNNQSLHLSSENDLDCYFMAILSRRKPPGSKITRTLWRNPSEQTRNYGKKEKIQLVPILKVLKSC